MLHLTENVVMEIFYIWIYYLKNILMGHCLCKELEFKKEK